MATNDASNPKNEFDYVGLIHNEIVSEFVKQTEGEKPTNEEVLEIVETITLSSPEYVKRFGKEYQGLTIEQVNEGIKDFPNEFKIVQEIKLTSENYFDLFIVGIGSFELIGEIKDELKKNFVNLNAPAIMFPYLRSFISTLTSNLGQSTGTLTIPPQFFKGELEVVDELY